MYIKIIAAICFLGGLVFLVHYFVTTPKVIVPPSSSNSNIPLYTSAPSDYVHEPGTFLSKSNVQLTDDAFMQDKKTEEINPGFYKNTNDEKSFGLFYFQKGGNLTVTLYGEDTKSSRLKAEKYIKSILGYTEEEFCTMDVTVITNVYENPTWAGINLGFSFCPGSVVLP